MAYEHILVERGAVAKIVLNRPDVRNAMSDLTLRELTDAFLSLGQDPSLRAVVVTGAGQDFCAGGDLEWMRRGVTMNPDEGKRDVRLISDMLSALSQCPVPVIVAAQGHVFGGGLGLLAASDITILADNAKLCFSEGRLGLVPALISCWVLPRIGAANARRYYLTAEIFGASQAQMMGLVHEVVREHDLDQSVKAVIDNIFKCGPKAVRNAKRFISALENLPLESRINLAAENLAERRASSEGREGIAAFLEKRRPSWVRGRS